eukprot:PhF_6_TR10988/c0_g1_i2/m.17774
MNIQSQRFPLDRKWRKTLVLMFCGVWLFTTINFAIAFSTSPVTHSRLLEKASNMFLIIFLPFGLGRAIHETTHHHVAKNSTMIFLFQVMNISNSVGALHVGVYRPLLFQAFLLMMAIAATNVPWWKAQCVSLLPGVFILLYNSTFGVNGYDAILIVSPEKGLQSEILAQFRGVSFGVMGVVGLRALSQAYLVSVRQLEGAVSVAKTVSEHLSECDTNAARKVLSMYSMTKDCDDDLYGVLTVIVENMNQYKPFLPNYILTSTTTTTTSSDNNEANPLEPQENNNALQVVDDVSMMSLVSHYQRRPSRLLAMIPTVRRISYAL